MLDYKRYEKPDIKRGSNQFCRENAGRWILTLEKIAEYAGLPLNEVKKLKAE